MKNFSAVSIFFAAALTVAAQTNTDAGSMRTMSLTDCIQQALAHNLDV